MAFGDDGLMASASEIAMGPNLSVAFLAQRRRLAAQR
jgi:hypothetical protein